MYSIAIIEFTQQMPQNDVDEPFAISVNSESESDIDNDLILYEGDTRNGSLVHTILK